MKNRFLALCFVLFFMCSDLTFLWCEAHGEPMKKLRIYMVLWRGITEAEKGFMDWFKDYPASRNTAVDFIIRDCQKDSAALNPMKAEIRAIKPDLIYIFGTTATQKIAGIAGGPDSSDSITDIPIVFNIVAYPVTAGLISNEKSSGRNLTGVSHLVPVEAQLNAMKSVRPFQKLGIIFNPEEDNALASVNLLENFAKTHSFALIKAPVKTGNDKKPLAESIPDTMMSLIKEKPDFIYLPSDSFIISHATKITAIANSQHTPTFSATEEPIRFCNAFMGLVSLYYNAGRFAGYKAEQILMEKKKPADIPIETLNRFSLLINMNAGHEIGFYPPVKVLKYAEIIHRDLKN